MRFLHTFFIGPMGLNKDSASLNLAPDFCFLIFSAGCFSTGHVHVAEYLKLPLHILFTMPWTYVFSPLSYTMGKLEAC
jgi:hypothetical protein